MEIIQNEILDALLHLATDSIPNIRFNVAKSMEVLATTYGTTAEGKALIQQKLDVIGNIDKEIEDVKISLAKTIFHSVAMGEIDLFAWLFGRVDSA